MQHPPLSMNYPHAHTSISPQGIATVTICEASALNLLSTPVIRGVTQAMEQLAQNASVRTVILRGTGDKAFVAGADIKEMGALNPESAKVFINNLRLLCESVRQFPAPVIARIPGWTLGGGLELALACDVRIASSHAHFGMPEVKVGIPSVIHAVLLPRLIGQARANWLLLTGDNIPAQQALAWGLVDTVCATHADMDQEIERLSQQFTTYGPCALRQQKRLLRQWQDESVDAAILHSVDEFASAFQTGEPAHHMRAFLEKKTGQKTGQKMA